MPGTIGTDARDRRLWYFENSLHLYREQQSTTQTPIHVRHLSWLALVLPPPSLANTLYDYSAREQLTTKDALERSFEKFDPFFKFDVICSHIDDWESRRFEQALPEKETKKLKIALHSTFMPFVKKLNVKLKNEAGVPSSTPNFDYSQFRKYL